MARRANPAFAVGAVAIPLVALGGAMLGADADLRGLFYVHVLAGVLWTGIDVFMGAVLGPVVGSLGPEERADFFGRFTPKMTFLLPTVATVTITGGIVLALRIGKFPNAMPWLALFTAGTTIPIVLLIASQFDALFDPRTLVILAVAVLGSGLFVYTTVVEYATTHAAILPATNFWIVLALVIVGLLSIQGFGLILPGEVRIYRQITSDEPDVDVIGAIGMRNAKLGGLQGAFQLVIIFVMVALRWGG